MKRSEPIIVVWDESDQDVTAEADAQYPDGMGMFARVQRRGREYGLGNIIGVARISRVSPIIRADAGVHCILNQGDAHAIEAAMDTLVLPPGSEQLLPALEALRDATRLVDRKLMVGEAAPLGFPVL